MGMVMSYMVNSLSGQDLPNPAMWLATQEAQSCQLGITRFVPQEK